MQNEKKKNIFFMMMVSACRRSISSGSRVFANTELHMRHIDAVGFDYDFTLAAYKPALQELIYDSARDYLLSHLKYPTTLRDCKYDPNFAIRGLMFDRKHGTLFKLSARQCISPGGIFRGRRRLGDAEAAQLYGGDPFRLHIPYTHLQKDLVPINDTFALAEACLLADVVQLAVDENIPFDPYWLHTDVRRAVEWVHVSGTMHGTVRAAPERFLDRNVRTKEMLERTRASGKKVFLLTNSGFDFVDAGMKYLLDDDEWLSLFDVAIFESSKPGFFESQKPFRRLNVDNSFAKWGEVRPADIDRGRSLVGGSLQEFMRLTGWVGKRVLYFGDHVFADLQEPARESGWATGAIISEVEEHVAVIESDAYGALLREAVANEAALAQNDSVGRSGSESGGARKPSKFFTDMRALNYRKRGAMFNANFGNLFRSQGDTSSYASFVQRYADVYTSDVNNLLFYPEDCCFRRPEMGNMPHEANAAAGAHGGMSPSLP